MENFKIQEINETEKILNKNNVKIKNEKILDIAKLRNDIIDKIIKKEIDIEFSIEGKLFFS